MHCFRSFDRGHFSRSRVFPFPKSNLQIQKKKKNHFSNKTKPCPLIIPFPHSIIILYALTPFMFSCSFVKTRERKQFKIPIFIIWYPFFPKRCLWNSGEHSWVIKYKHQRQKAVPMKRQHIPPKYGRHWITNGNQILNLKKETHFPVSTLKSSNTNSQISNKKIVLFYSNRIQSNPNPLVWISSQVKNWSHQ